MIGGLSKFVQSPPEAEWLRNTDQVKGLDCHVVVTRSSLSHYCDIAVVTLELVDYNWPVFTLEIPPHIRETGMESLTLK